MNNSSTADWFQDRIAAAVAPLLPGFAVEAVAEIDSTNTELMRRARAGRVEPVLLVTERQTAGRGRMGRPWQSSDARQHEQPQRKPAHSQPRWTEDRATPGRRGCERKGRGRGVGGQTRPSIRDATAPGPLRYASPPRRRLRLAQRVPGLAEESRAAQGYY